MALRYQMLGFNPNFVPYQDGLHIQEERHAQVVDGSAENTLFMLEHEAVYTAGRRTEPSERPHDGTAVIDIDRGGKITWHGPGQLVAYPIIKLRDRGAVKRFVQELENIVVSVLASYGITGTVIEERPGVWVIPEDGGAAKKIAAIGLRIHLGVSKHGIAINVNNEMAPFSNIIPCGITDAGVTSILRETGNEVSPAEVAVRLQKEFDRIEPLIAALSEDIDPAEASKPYV